MGASFFDLHVLLDGVPVCACLVAVGQVENQSITTVEGLKSRAPLFGGLPGRIATLQKEMKK